MASPKGNFVHGLSNPEYARKFASLVSEFEHMETHMPNLLAALMGLEHAQSAAYVYRTLRNPSIRASVLKELLEKAPCNEALGDEFDVLLSEYEAARVQRNAYVHGLWYTSLDDRSVWFSRSDDGGLGFYKAKKEPIKNLDAVLKLIRSLTQKLALMRLGDPPRIGRFPE